MQTSKYHELLSISLKDCSLEQIEILNGLMLGDGCIHYYRNTAKYPRLTNTRKAFWKINAKAVLNISKSNG